MKVICFGDSLTSCGGDSGRFSDILQARFPAHHILNRGVGGESFVEAMLRFEQDVLAECPQVVLIEFGANDWWRDERPYTDWARDLENCVVRCKQIGAQPIILGVFGRYRTEQDELAEKVYGIDERALAYRKLEEEIAVRHGCGYCSNIQQEIIGNRRCWSDANHPNEYGNRYVADMIEPLLAATLQTPALSRRKPTLETTRDFWREALQEKPHGLAAVDGTRRITFSQADALVERLAAALYASSGQARPRVAVYMANSLEYYLLYWAVQRMGGVVVPLNTWLKEESLRGVFTTVAPHLLCLREGETAALPCVIAEESATPTLSLPMLDPMLAGWQCWATLPPAPESPLTGDDLSIIMHTSGTTSTPKGAMMRHRDLMFNVAAAINAHDFSPNDIHLLVNPMFHCTALYSSLPTAAYQKSPVIITAESEAETLLALVETERITTFLSVPSVFQKILHLRDRARYDTSSLRVMAYAGSPMPVPVIRALRAAYPEVALHNFFGLTETISMTHVLRNDDVENRPDSIGRLLPFVEALVVDDSLKPLPAGETGELLFAHEEIIPGYYCQPERLQEALIDINDRSWFRTGDLAMVDDEGYYSIKGRKKDMIIVGGENVFAVEVEAILAAHPLVREVAVKGIPASGVRAHLGELIKAYVVPADPGLSERDLKQHCFERLPSYKVPSFISFLPTLPRNPAGKVVKDDLP